MARRGKKKGRPVSGWLILDKPVGMGSTDAVAKIKWLFQAEKAGHAGTLDPLASGMLPIALGEATKTVPYVMDGAKVYRFTVAWGEERSTDDLEGPVTKTSDKRPSEAEIRALLPKYTGVIMQTPPQFSAIKIGGERAYDLAREGESVDIPPREIEIGRLDLVETTADGHSIFETECGKGTYVRSLARDMGRDLGCFGHIAELRRVEVEPFTAEDFVTLKELEAVAPPKPDPDQPAEFEGGLLVAVQPRFSLLELDLLGRDAKLVVEFAADAIALQERDGSVSLTLRHNGSEEQLHADYVVGCDGTNSFVRGALKPPRTSCS
jgi:tRNA pseudouridine55 synthase